MAEVHIIGQIKEAKDFPSQSLYCKWYFHSGNNWKVVAGKNEGQTHVALSDFSQVCNWSFPIDIHLATAGVQEILLITVLSTSKFSEGILEKNVTLVTSPIPKILESFETTLASCIENSCTTESVDNSTLDQLLNETLSSENTTEIPTTTPSSGKVPSTSLKTTLTPDYTSLMDICTCDLTVSICDINCCCDIDCNKRDKEIFTKCNDFIPRVYDTRFCNYSQYIYVNNTPYEWNINQNSLFCVAHSNYPLSYTIHKPIITSYELSKMKFKGKLSTYHDSDQTDTIKEMKRVIFNENLWVIKDGLEKFQIPSNFMSNSCNLMKDILFLRNVKTKCVQDKEDSVQLRSENYFENIKVIAQPQLFNSSSYKNIVKDCPNTVCIQIGAKMCDKDFVKCENFSRKFHDPIVYCKNVLRDQRKCYNIVTHVKYIIRHNGSSGIVNAEVYLVKENITYNHLVENFELLQKFIVLFLWPNETEGNYSSIRSGNPGYLFGRQIITGHLIQEKVENSTQIIYKIVRKSDIGDNFLVLPKNENGKCILSNSSFSYIEFGVNRFSTCKIKEQINEINIKNITEICQNIQRVIFSYSSISESFNKTISLWGNANSSVVEDWSEINVNEQPQEIIKNVNGSWVDSKNKILLCTNLTTNLGIQIFHARFDRNHLLNQQKIVAASFHFINKRNISFDVESLGAFQFEVPLTTEVVFEDITGQKIRQYAEPPSLKIKLPYDFFYPFVKVNNKAERGKVCSVIYFYLSLVLIIINQCI